MKSDVLLYQSTKTAHKITLNRPQHGNALNAELLSKLNAQLVAIADSNDTLPVIIQSTGKNFCTGMDLNVAQHDHESMMCILDELQLTLTMMKQLSHPIIIGIQGNIFGAGVALIACADIVYAIQGCCLSFPEVKIGLAPTIIAPFISHVLGPRLTRYFFLTAASIHTKQAHQLGLIHEYFEDLDSLTKHIDMMTHQLTQAPDLTLKKIKEITQQHTTNSVMHSQYFLDIWPTMQNRINNHLQSLK